MDILQATKTAVVNSIGASYKETMKKDFDRHRGAVKKSFQEDDMVYTTKHQGNKITCVPGTVQNRSGKINYDVELEGKIMKKHANRLKPRLPPHGGKIVRDDHLIQLEVQLPPLRRLRKTQQNASSDTPAQPRHRSTGAAEETSPRHPPSTERTLLKPSKGLRLK